MTDSEEDQGFVGVQPQLYRACEVLRRSGLDVQSSDIPGLTWVDGRELTVGQVIDLAAEIQ